MVKNGSQVVERKRTILTDSKCITNETKYVEWMLLIKKIDADCGVKASCKDTD